MSGTLEPSPFFNDFRAILGHNEEIFGPWSGVIFRSVSPQYARPYDILSGHGAYQAGGCWNAPGIYAIYGSLEPGLAADESFNFMPSLIRNGRNLVIYPRSLKSESKIEVLGQDKLPK
jgi:hypothetical protein